MFLGQLQQLASNAEPLGVWSDGHVVQQDVVGGELKYNQTDDVVVVQGDQTSPDLTILAGSAVTGPGCPQMRST